MNSITINKNSVHGDKSALSPGGVRLGSAALTTRGFAKDDFVHVAQFLHRALTIAISIQESSGSKLLKDFLMTAKGNSEIEQLGKDVLEFASQFPMPGHCS